MTESTSKSNPNSHEWKRFYKYELINGDTYEKKVSSFNHKWVDTADGIKNPRWKYRVRTGQQAGTSFVGYRETASSSPYIFSQNSVYVGSSVPSSYSIVSYQHWGQYQPPTPVNPLNFSLTLANNRALEQLVRKVRSKQTTFQGGVAAGEMLQTIALVTNPAKSLRKGIDHYIDSLRGLRKKHRRSGNHKRNMRNLRTAVEDTWLEYQLGWAPLVSDIKSGAQAIAERSKERSWQPVRAVGTDEESSVVSPNYLLTSTRPRVTVDGIRQDTSQVRYIACVDTGSFAPLDLRRVGLDWSNAPLVAWELLPWSFVIDYFTNIGTIVSAASLARSSVRWTIKTTRRTSKTMWTNHRVEKAPADSSSWAHTITQQTPGKSVWEKAAVTRDPYYGSYTPDLVFSLPTGKQFLNIGALFSARSRMRTYYT